MSSISPFFLCDVLYHSGIRVQHGTFKFEEPQTHTSRDDPFRYRGDRRLAVCPSALSSFCDGRTLSLRRRHSSGRRQAEMDGQQMDALRTICGDSSLDIR